MRCSFLHILILILAITVDCQRLAGSTGNYQSRKEGEWRNGPDSSSAGKSLEAKSISGGIGAWGYIAICLTVILTGISVYYFAVFYPIVCKKERMYDVMEMTTV